MRSSREGWEIKQGDALSVLKTMPAQSINTCVTSPPYWGLRDYGVDGQLGLEPTPTEYVANLVEVFREVRRVLRDDGTLWLNLGDSYNGTRMNRSGQHGYKDGRSNRDKRFSVGGVEGLKPKDLVGIPWRVAFALQADGWYLRSDIIWHKPNSMPESVTDRPTKAHEYIFLLTKSRRYFYDADAIREPHAEASIARWSDGGEDTDNTKYRKERPDTSVGNLRNGSNPLHPAGRNKRTVWTVPTQPFPEAHFAVFPPALITPCILAGCPVGGTVLDPFAGSGTTLLVATQHRRKSIGIELNPEYIEIAKRRLNSVQLKLVME
jgi:DNA modification methylase